MITINKLKISSNLKNLEIKVTSSNIGSRFSKIFIWNVNTFRDYSKAIDVSQFLVKNSNIEDITISAESINKTMFDGIYFVEFRTNEEPVINSQGVPNNQSLGVVANLFKYKECLLNKSLQVDVKNCGKNTNECSECKDNLCLLNTLLSSLNISLMSGFLEETVKIAKQIENLCNICNNCPDYGNTKSYSGKGLMYQIENNEILVDKKEESKPVCNPTLPSASNGFYPVYIKYLDNFVPSETEALCNQLVPVNCFTDIAYLYLPNGPDNWNFNRDRVLYNEPIREDRYLVKPLDGKQARYFIFENITQASVIPSLSGQRPMDLGVVRIEGEEIKFYEACCGCPR